MIVVIAGLPGILAMFFMSFFLIFLTIYAIIKGRAHSLLQDDKNWFAILLCSIIAYITVLYQMQGHPLIPHNPFFGQ